MRSSDWSSDVCSSDLRTRTGTGEAGERRQSALRYRRVLLKLSGEGLLGPREYGLDPITVDRIAAEVGAVSALGAQICLVIGGGNIFRGVSGAASGMERATADYMGMLATVINALRSEARRVGKEGFSKWRYRGGP